MELKQKLKAECLKILELKPQPVPKPDLKFFKTRSRSAYHSFKFYFNFLDIIQAK